MEESFVIVSKSSPSHYTIHYTITIDSTPLSFPLLSSYSAVLHAAGLTAALAEQDSCEPISYTTHCSLPFVFLSSATTFHSLPVTLAFGANTQMESHILCNCLTHTVSEVSSAVSSPCYSLLSSLYPDSFYDYCEEIEPFNASLDAFLTDDVSTNPHPLFISSSSQLLSCILPAAPKQPLFYLYTMLGLPVTTPITTMDFVFQDHSSIHLSRENQTHSPFPLVVSSLQECRITCMRFFLFLF